MDAINALEPPPDVPPQSPAWEVYEPLFYRYVKQLTQRQVAKQLGMSVRHLRRKEHAALEVLASHLWDTWDLGKTDGNGHRVPVDSTSPDNGEAGGNDTQSPTVQDELMWLKEMPPEAPIDVHATFQDVLEIARPTFARQHVSFVVTPSDVETLPPVAVHAVALKQTLLNLLLSAAHLTAGGEITVTLGASDDGVEIGMQGRCAGCPDTPSADDRAKLESAAQLADLCDGELSYALEAQTFTASLVLPSIGQLTVLVVDDNRDTLQLFSRYVAGTRYHAVTSDEPAQILNLAESLAPEIIVLDVMMPDIDGWKILAQLKQHPATADVPVLVCTILPQEEIALDLGASGFLSKPVTRKRFLAALDAQLDRTA
jgi:CheY-like chemotaxis protein